VLAEVELAGISSCVPKRVVTNKELEALVDTSDEWIIKRTGIRSRHIAVEETANSMAGLACKRALASAGISKEAVGIIIACTVTGENLTPSMAGSVQKALGVKTCAAMDVSAGCTGFIYGLITAASLMHTLKAEAALVVASETLSKYADWSDRATCVLFGDGAGAAVLTRSEKPMMHFPMLCASPDEADVIVIKKEERPTPFNKKINTNTEYLRMKGREVFEYAVSAMEDALNALSLKCGSKPFTKIIPHQANAKIIDYVARAMNLRPEQFFVNIDEYANTSSATIPTALADAYQSGWLEEGDRVALVGFGSGLTSGGVVIDWTMPKKRSGENGRTYN